jgi:hypothetical protein
MAYATTSRLGKQDSTNRIPTLFVDKRKKMWYYPISLTANGGGSMTRVKRLTRVTALRCVLILLDSGYICQAKYFAQPCLRYEIKLSEKVGKLQ